MTPALAPAEFIVLLRHPERTRSREAMKATLLQLIMRGALRAEQVAPRRGRFRLFGTQPRTVYRLGPGAVQAQDACAEAVLRVVRDAGSEGETMPQLVRRLGRAFRQDMAGFTDWTVVPLLVGRGLMRRREGRFLWIFPTSWTELTPAGVAEQGRLRALVAEAERIPALLDTNPREAAALALALGASIVAIEALRPHLNHIAAAVQQHRPTDSGSGSSGESGSGDWGEVDFGSFDSVAAELDTAAASFDSSADSGGDGGGGDGGGGGD